MDDRQRRRGEESVRALLAARHERNSVARHFSRERERQELRRERDAVMLRIAGDLGVGTLAQQLDVTPAVVDRLVSDARERLNAGPAGSGPTITVRRLASAHDRWAEIDTYYEALGSRPTIRARRLRPPQG